MLEFNITLKMRVVLDDDEHELIAIIRDPAHIGFEALCYDLISDAINDHDIPLECTVEEVT